MSETRLVGVSFRGCDPHRAQFVRLELTNANLSRCDPHGRDLSHATLTGAGIEPATYDSSTRRPAGFNPKDRGAILAVGLPLTGLKCISGDSPEETQPSPPKIRR